MADDHKHEIVIIRRGNHGDHDEHHGGVWKIAFADFMTAMMAFFLVMWLISANDKTRASVARYFNPVRLVDATTQPRGLHESKKDESGITALSSKDAKTLSKEASEASASPAKQKPETSEARDKRLDTALRENPYVALAEIAAAKSAADGPSAAARPVSLPVIGRRGGESFRDPFAPPPPLPNAATKTIASETAGTAAQEPTAPASLPQPKAAPAVVERSDVKAQILASLRSGNHAAGPRVDVRRTSEGLLVSLTDTVDFSMFSNGSAVPARRVVLLMEKVAQVLKGKPGTVIVRGFTDSKPYRSGRYDNWHLSLDRAQVMHYMLVRGGLEDARIGHIEGFADRGAKLGADAASPLNRRIEILLKDDQP